MSDSNQIQPTSSTERIGAMDTIRGISLLGILLMNILGFGLYNAYFDPTNHGGATGWNLRVWWINMLLIEGTMRGLFSILFGAGILLFTARSVESKDGTPVTDLFFRRLLWLVVFGIIHCYLLLWDGEILYCYGLVGMFAFSFRHLSPRHLIAAATFVLLISAALSAIDYFDYADQFEKATAAQAKKNAGESLSKEDSTAIAQWDDIVAEEKVTPQQLEEEMTAASKGYWSIVMHKIPVNIYMQTTFIYLINFWDTLQMMLFGMALFKLGILKAARSNSFYWRMALIGYSMGIAVNYFETAHIVSSQFSILSFYQNYLTYPLGRIPTTCGHIALIMLFVRSGWLPFLQKSLAAVGQMALTNYILHTVICNFIFLGFGLSLYGKLQRYELYYIVVGIWIFQLIASPIWLKYFRFGPLEWLWRSLTYGKRQPMRR